MNGTKSFFPTSLSRQVGLYVACLIFVMLLGTVGLYAAWQAVPVADDPLVRMPGTQPAQGVSLEGPRRCLNCHAGYNQSVEPGFNWMGSMMAQAARDPIFWACMTVAIQDSIWAIGTPNAADLCERCHFPEGWLGGRSDPPNASAMTGSDYDGLHCDFCHSMYDPFFQATHNGQRGETDWDEAGNLSLSEAETTYQEDQVLATAVRLFNGGNFFANNEPVSSSYTENASGQYFVSTNAQKRASFADAAARHQMLYSRSHKSKYFCGTCHDVSNPVLANLGADPAQPLPTETLSASSYYHVERTFSEFMLSAYGQPGGAATNPEFQAQGAPDITWASKCQDCHMRDVRGVACNKQGVPIRPDESTEHPNSGQPLHDLTGGNIWISYILGTLDPNGGAYDTVNEEILDQGPAVLTLDLDAGETPKENGAALLAGSERAKQQLKLAATIKNLAYSSGSGDISFRVQNNTGHKLISGFPEGRRMFINIKAYAGGNLLHEINPYDSNAGTLKEFAGTTGPNETYRDDLVYEVHPSSSLTDEHQTFHFVLATGRSKDNRIPPKGFRSAEAPARFSQAVGMQEPYTPDEYAGGYDEVSLSGVLPGGADLVEVTLYYQGTSREYIEFLRDEINGTATTLSSPTPSGQPIAYIAQTDPFFGQLKAWGNTIWELWAYNHGLGSLVGRPYRPPVEGIAPFEMATATTGTQTGCGAATPALLSAVPGHGTVTLTWTDEHAGDPLVAGYSLYYDQAGKAQLVAALGLVTTYTDTGLTDGQSYSYKVTLVYDGCESAFSNILSATPEPPGQLNSVGVNPLQTGYYGGRGKNKLFVLASSFALGEQVTVRAYVVDGNGTPIVGATVEISITGPESATLTTGPSDANGVAEANWQTQKPNKKGRGGTAPGLYAATTSNVIAEGYTWDGVPTSTTFSLQ
jgi:hypothetical protein